MATFLSTSGISHHLEQIINNSEEKLLLISPFLKFNFHIKQFVEDKTKLKIDIRVVYGKSELSASEESWLRRLSGVQVYFLKDLHAKCYMNEQEGMITSMNLYDYSQHNNFEMGVFFTRKDDPELYETTYKEAQRLIRMGGDGPVVAKEETYTKKVVVHKPTGYCIRTGVEIPFDVLKPFSKEAFKAWSKFENEAYPEKYCHFTGEPSHGETSMQKPVLKKNWKEAQRVHEF